MRWKSNPREGWYDGFAVVPTLMSDGTWLWLEPYRYFFNRFGVVSTVIAASQK